MAKRRSNGEGSIRKRRDGRWEGRYTAGINPETGKQVFKNVLGKTQAEVKEKLAKALAENQKLDFTKQGKYNVAQWMDEWFENVCKIKVRPSSHQTYRGYIDRHIAPNIGKIPLEKLSTMDLQKFYRRLLADGRVERIESKGQPKGLSAKTVRNINQVISSDLLETSIKGARRLIVNVTMSEDLLISDMDELTAAIADAADDNVEIIFGNGTNPDTKDAMDVTVIAADFVDRDDVPEAAAPKAATTYTANFTQKADDAKADAEAMHKAGVKAADNPNYYDDIFNIFKNK